MMVRCTLRVLPVLCIAAMAGCMQLPTVPTTPAVPGAAAAPAAPCNLWSFLCPTDQQRQSFKNCICACPLGQMLNSMLKPMSAMSGGLLPGGICPGPNQANPADLAKPADSAEGAAARIKQSEADAKARRAAVRYLGTVDCRRFPEAEAAIVNALLTDPNECVRLEAALSLTRACCCTQKTVHALTQAVSGKGSGNDPPETSERVRYAAAMALERCLARGCTGCGEEPRRPENPAPPEKPLPAEPPVAAPPPAAPGPAAATQAQRSPSLQQAARVLDEYWAARQPRAIGVMSWQQPEEADQAHGSEVRGAIVGGPSPSEGGVPRREGVDVAMRPPANQAAPLQTPLATGQRGLINLIRSSLESPY
jgi:hypothetical protein